MRCWVVKVTTNLYKYGGELLLAMKPCTTHTRTRTRMLHRYVLCYQRFACVNGCWCVSCVQKVSFGDFSVQEVSNLYTQGTNQLEVRCTTHASTSLCPEENRVVTIWSHQVVLFYAFLRARCSAYNDKDTFLTN